MTRSNPVRVTRCHPVGFALAGPGNCPGCLRAPGADLHSESTVCDITPRAQVALPVDASAPGIARDFLSASVCTSHAIPVLDAAILLTSETITNAVMHGLSPIVLAVDCIGTALEIRVRDGSAQLPAARSPGMLDEGGRGMMLVDILSDAWGVEPAPAGGKEVWFRLRIG